MKLFVVKHWRIVYWTFVAILYAGVLLWAHFQPEKFPPIYWVSEFPLGIMTAVFFYAFGIIAETSIKAVLEEQKQSVE